MNTVSQVVLTWASRNDIGERSSNQDTIGLAEQDGMSCFVVSDGAGGHAGGEVASRLVVDTITERFCTEAAFGSRALLSYVNHAIARVAQGKQQVHEQQDMSATVATLLIDAGNARAVWAHLGDTRLYLFRAGRVAFVTRDHSLTQQLIDAGFARHDQLRAHPQRNILFAAIGAEGVTPVASSGDALDLQDGDAFLLCSDGLWEWVMEEDMERTLGASRGDAEAWLAAMCAVGAANAATSGKRRDNFSAYAIQIAQTAVQQ
jgi:serine/threonine protein phosphatase PrpC